jgi:hypothetical protein
MTIILAVVGGVSWTVVYLIAIQSGLQDRTYAIPLVALSLNFAWEVIYTFRGFYIGLRLQTWLNMIWTLTDGGIVVTYLMFGRAEFPSWVSRPIFLTTTAFTFIAAFTIQLTFISEFGVLAGLYSSFLQNAFMSASFIAMFVARRGLRGQRLMIAVFKLIGTLAMTLDFGFAGPVPSHFVQVIGAVCLVLDIIYVLLVVLHRRGHLVWLGEDEWKASSLQTISSATDSSDS